MLYAPPPPPVEQLMREALAKTVDRKVVEAEVVAEHDATNGAFCEPTADYGGTVTGDLGEPSPASEDAVFLSEEFFETDVREAVGLLASEAGADVLMDDRVRGVVNVSIEEATFEEALDKVLLPLGFVVGRRNKQYVICPPDPESPLFPYVSTQLEYRPKYLQAKDLLAAPPQQMLKFVRVVENTNALVIEAPTQHARMILERIRRLDQPVPQVELEAIVCVVSPDSGFRFGLDWGHAYDFDSERVLNLGSSGLALSGLVTPYGLNNAFDDFATTTAFVKLLAENGYLTIRASPRVMAEDGKQAKISIGRQTFFAIQPPGATGDNSTFFYQQDIQTVESGIELEITPHVRGDLVTVEIEKAEVSEDIRSAAAELALNPYPIINRRSVSTTVHVQDGKTIVIGGLVQRETVDRVNRVPGLSRVPGVGYLFKSVERQAREAEVVIFIAPRIVRPASCQTACLTPIDSHLEVAPDEIAPPLPTRPRVEPEPLPPPVVEAGLAQPTAFLPAR